MEGDEWDGTEVPVTGPIDNFVQAKLRNGARLFARDALSPQHCNAAATAAVAASRRWVAETLPIGVEALLLPYLDKLAAWAANPETGRKLSDDALSIVSPLLE